MQSVTQLLGERIVAGREHSPIPVPVPTRRLTRGQGLLDEIDAERSHPRIDAFGVFLPSSMFGKAGLNEVLKRLGEFTDARIGIVGGRGRRRQRQLPRGFGDQLPDGDRIQMEIFQEAVLCFDRFHRQFGATSHQLADEF